MSGKVGAIFTFVRKGFGIFDFSSIARNSSARRFTFNRLIHRLIYSNNKYKICGYYRSQCNEVFFGINRKTSHTIYGGIRK